MHITILKAPRGPLLKEQNHFNQAMGSIQQMLADI